MVHDLSQDTAPPAAGGSGPRQAVAGLMPPQLGEAMIRECWPSVVARGGGIAHVAAALMKTVVLAPLGWLLLGPLFVLRIAPFICRRYTLTNRRLMIRKGLRPSPVQELPLDKIDDVRLGPGGVDPFFRCGDLEVVSNGQVALKLRGVPEPDSFSHAIVNAVRAWVPGKAKGPFQPASAVKL
jgi:hypothetical protein